MIKYIPTIKFIGKRKNTDIPKSEAIINFIQRINKCKNITNIEVKLINSLSN